jgi:hypothetical protein
LPSGPLKEVGLTRANIAGPDARIPYAAYMVIEHADARGHCRSDGPAIGFHPIVNRLQAPQKKEEGGIEPVASDADPGKIREANWCLAGPDVAEQHAGLPEQLPQPAA